MAGDKHVRGRKVRSWARGLRGRQRLQRPMALPMVLRRPMGEGCDGGRRVRSWAVDDGRAPIAMLLVCDGRVSSSAALGDDGCGGWLWATMGAVEGCEARDDYEACEPRGGG
jgi:hypothetical protein